MPTESAVPRQQRRQEREESEAVFIQTSRRFFLGQAVEPLPRDRWAAESPNHCMETEKEQRTGVSNVLENEK